MEEELILLNLRNILGKESYILRSEDYVFYCNNPNGCNKMHHKPKLYVNLQKHKFHCWVCHWGGKTLKPILKFGDRNFYIDYCKFCSFNKIKVSEIKKFEKIELPKEYRFLFKEQYNSFKRNFCLNYLYGRNLNKLDIFKFKIGLCEEGEYENRIIIPSFDEYGNINFFTSRSMFKDFIKYKTPFASKDIIFNDYLIDWAKKIFLVEGPFDSFCIKNSIPLQGTFLNEESLLFQKIINFEPEICVVLDANEVKNRNKILKLLFSNNIKTSFIELSDFDYKDPSEIKKKDYKKVLSGEVSINSFKDFFSKSLVM